MKVYYSLICEDCRNFINAYYSRVCEGDKEIVSVFKNRDKVFELINITDSTDNLKEFLCLRDSSPAFENVRKNGGIGIPAFVDGSRVSFDVEEALSWAEIK